MDSLSQKDLKATVSPRWVSAVKIETGAEWMSAIYSAANVCHMNDPPILDAMNSLSFRDTPVIKPHSIVIISLPHRSA